MSAERSDARPLADLIGGLLSNPAVLEGLIAGISAISASRRSKASSDGGGGAQQDGGGLLDALPGILPLLAVLTNPSQPSPTAEPTEATPDAGVRQVMAQADADDGADMISDDVTNGGTGDGSDDFSSLFSDGGSSGADGASSEEAQPVFGGASVQVTGVSRESQRENLLLAIRPFLSDSRRSAADAMVQVNRLSGMFRRR